MDSARLNETIKSSREILKLVDQLVKANNLEKALHEVKKARELDPKNLYALAYEERIQELYTQRQRQEANAKKSAKDSQSPAQPAMKPYNIQEQIIDEKKDMYGVKMPALYEEFKKAGLKPSGENKPNEMQGASKEALETYKQALLLVWSDGQKTDDEIRELQDLKQSLSISDEEGESLDRQAKLECYIFLLKHLLRSPASKKEVEAGLAEIRKSFDVSSQEHHIIEAQLLSHKGKKGKKADIIVVDDDQQMLTLMKEFLVLAHYNVTVFSTSDEAYEFLEKERTDLILCDISLETSTMNGFLFYEKIRELRHLQQVPFVFITGLNDAVLMRAGKEMGVDDFLIKPIHQDFLLATIRGKIKRYQQMKTHSEE